MCPIPRRMFLWSGVFGISPLGFRKTDAQKTHVAIKMGNVFGHDKLAVNWQARQAQKKAQHKLPPIRDMPAPDRSRVDKRTPPTTLPKYYQFTILSIWSKRARRTPRSPFKQLMPHFLQSQLPEVPPDKRRPIRILKGYKEKFVRPSSLSMPVVSCCT